MDNSRSGGRWQPSDSIGIALSGGGSRAAAFHLGTMDYLHRQNLLCNVEMLSSASGGSFITAKYALLLAELLQEKKVLRKRDEAAYKVFFNSFFTIFFEDSYRHLRDTRAIEKVNSTIGKERAADALNYRIPSGRYALINIAADLYAETFLLSRKGTPYLLGELLAPPEGYPLKHVILNATDYHNGVAFRFTSNPDTHIGNVFLFENCKAEPGAKEVIESIRESCKKIRVADIVAASSCLPPLFEPIGFPDDFAWPEGKIPKPLRDLCSEKQAEGKIIPRPVPLMDGGLYDNQAIESLMLADRGITLKELNNLLLAGKWDNTGVPEIPGNVRSESLLGMFIVSDADRKDVDDDKYKYNKQRNKRQFGTYKKGMSLGILLLLGTIFLGVNWLTTSFALWGTIGDKEAISLFLLFLQIVSWLGVTACGIFVVFIGLKFWKALQNTPQVGSDIWHGISRLRWKWLQDAVSSRFSSSLTTIFGILLKRTRDLGYFAFYGDTLYYKKRVSNLLFRLVPDAKTNVLSGAEDEWAKVCHLFSPSPKLQEYIQHANNVGTYFWYDEKEPWQQCCLVSAGQATTCFNLAQFIVRNYGGDVDTYPSDILLIWEKLLSDWKILTEDPYALLKARIKTLESTSQDNGHQKITCVSPPGPGG